MRNKENGNKKGGRKKLVNIISKLAKEQLNKSTEDGVIEKENVSVNDKDNGDNDDDCVVLVEHPESKRRSKRKPEKIAKSISDEVTVKKTDEMAVEEPDQMTVEEPGQMTVEEPDLMTVEEPGQMTVEESGQMTVEEPGQMTVEEPGQMTVEEPDQMTVEEPDQMTVEEPDQMTVEEPDQMTVEEPDSSQVATESLDNNQTIVKAVVSEDECEETPENMGNESEEKVGNKKIKSDFKKQNDANLKVVNCTACGKSILTKKGKFCRHPDLNTIICKQCYKFYSSGKFTKDEYGVEEFCRWCADGGQLICCDFCEKAFCKKCIKRNLGKSKFEELLEADEDEKWSCFCCDPAPISDIIKLCNRVMSMLDKEKDQNSPYKDKRGREIIHGPNRSERRNILTNLSEEQSFKNKAKTFPNSKKTYSKCFENGLSSSANAMDNNKENSKENNIENVTVKKEQEDKCKSIVTTVVLDEDNDVNSDELSETKKARKSNKKGESLCKTESSSESDAVQEKSTDQDTNNSSEQEIIRSKKKSRDKKRSGKSKSDRKRIDSDSADDFVQAKKKKRTNKKKFVVSSDEESDEETDEHGDTDSSEQESSEPSVKRSRGNNKKNKRHDFRSSDSEGDSIVADSPKKRKKNKGIKKVGKWSLRRKYSGSNTSDSESEKENVKKSKSKKKVNKKNLKKKGKLKRKRKEDDGDDDDNNESDDENVSPSKKGRKKIRKILDNEKLAEATRHARQLEEERRQRLVERTKSVVFEKPDSCDVKELVLEYKSDGKTPLVEVGDDLVRHLKPHQVEGVKFMYDCTIESVERWKKKEPGGGCILAHVMGLGKTLQVVSLVHTLYESSLIKLRRVLVVCPLNTVLNWQVEFEKWLSVDDRLDVYVLNEVKSSNWHRADMLKQWMSYGGILIMGYTMYRNLSQCLRVKSKHQKKIFKESLVDPGPELVVCDEGHVLRNCKSAISIAMNGIKTKRRIVLTGTPLQNNLLEYHCMVSFVKPNLLGTLKEFSNSFIRPIENGQCADSTTTDVKIMKRRCHVLHKMLEGCVQRKDYAEIERFLPPKFEYVIKVRLSTKQREMYKYYLDTFLGDEDNKGKGGTLFSDYQALMRIWTHPWSLKLESARQIENFIDSDDSLKDFVVESDEETEASEEMSWTSDDADSESDKGKRGKKRSKSTSEESEEDENEEEIPKTSNKQKSGKRTDRKERNGNVKGIVKANPDGPSTSKASVVVDSDEDIVEVKPDVSKKAVAENRGASMVYSTLRSGQEFKDPTPVVEEEEWYDKFLTEEDENNVELGSKIVLLLEVLADAAALEEKVLVFSHSLISLDVIEMALGGGEIGGNSEDWCRGCDYFRMDGSTSVQMRKRWADIFNDEENKAARLFLISTKAGGLGINLVGASRVIVFDVSWNPSHDVQSIFRAYRFGQNKPVFVYRFIAEGTMEEKIYDRQVTKLSMSQRVIDEHQIQRHFNANDLAELYRFEPDILENENDERPTPAVPKDAVLAELINRLYPKWIVKYHEHDSLLQNRPEEELTEAERKEAWEQWELEKQGIVNEAKMRAETMQRAEMMNGVAILIDGQVPHTGIPGPRPFTHSGPRVPAPHTLPTFPGVRPPNYQHMVLDEQRRRLFEMEKRRVQEESDRLARANLLRLQQQQQQLRQRQEEEEKRARVARERAEQQRLQAEEKRIREQHRQRAEQQLIREQQRIREQQQRAQQQRAQQQQQREQRQRQEQQRQQQEQQIGQAFLQQLLRNRGAYVTQQAGQGHSSQRVFQVVLDDNAGNNPVQSQRRQRSPPRIIELPPDA